MKAGKRKSRGAGGGWIAFADTEEKFAAGGNGGKLRAVAGGRDAAQPVARYAAKNNSVARFIRTNRGVRSGQSILRLSAW